MLYYGIALLVCYNVLILVKLCREAVARGNHLSDTNRTNNLLTLLLVIVIMMMMMMTIGNSNDNDSTNSRGKRLSNTTCLTLVFFKSRE